MLGAKVFDAGTQAGLGFWGNVKHVLEQEYTLWAAFLEIDPRLEEAVLLDRDAERVLGDARSAAARAT